MPETIAVVGGGAAGVSAVETLRREGFAGRLVLVGEEPGLPYDRPPLSKQVLSGAWAPDRVQLRNRDHYADLDVTLYQSCAVGLDLAARRISFADRTQLAYDGLVIATGVVPRQLPFGHELPGVHVLRTVEDALALRADITSARHIVVVGAGFLGTEVAAAARGLDRAVTLVDPLPVPMIRQVGKVVAEQLHELHRGHGVALRTSTAVAGFRTFAGRVSGVALDDGTVVDADCVLIAIGALPAVDWLLSSGLTVDNGVECDEYCRAAPDVYAAGDVASWPNARYGRRMRLEHRTNAGEQGTVAARNLLLGNVEPFTPLPFFWSDQYDARLHAHGYLAPDADVEIVDGATSESKFVALYRQDGHITGVLGWNSVKQTMPYRKQLAAQPFPVDQE